MNRVLMDYLNAHDYPAVTEDCVRWIRTWFQANGPDSPAVVGISGGKDSSTVAALCVKALGSDRVFGVLMPNGFQSDIEMAHRLVDFLAIPHTEINIREGVNGLRAALRAGLGNAFPETEAMRINLPPRIRMTTLYAVAQCMNGRVSNNCNRSEDYVGYSTLFGDAAGDFSPLKNLTVSEVWRVGACLGLPKELIEKIPSDGLTERTDEDNFGFSYEALDTYILTGHCDDIGVEAKIRARHEANRFKHRPMSAFCPDIH